MSSCQSVKINHPNRPYRRRAFGRAPVDISESAHFLAENIVNLFQD
jgi:hypothetical protein